MGKYDAWKAFFEELSEDPSIFAIEDLAALIPGGLPPSAYKYQAWWASPQNHAVWRRDGWRASPNFAGETVTFTRAPSTLGRPLGRNNSGGAQSDVGGLATDSSSERRLVLVGCVSSKLAQPAPAKDLYTSPLWQKRRAYAEESGMPWGILSAEYGLVDPGTVIEPYDTYMGDQSSEYQRSWSNRTADQILDRVRGLGIAAVEVHAGSSYLEHGLINRLNSADVKVFWPLKGLRFGEQLAWYPSGGQPTDQPSEDPLKPYKTEAEVLAAALRELADRIDREILGIGDIAPVEAEMPTGEQERSIVELLLTHGEALREKVASTPEPEFTPDPEANRFLWSDPFAFLVAVIADYQIPAERAWAVPWELKKRIGHLDPQLMLEDPSALYEAFDQRPKLHRFVKNVPKFILEACRLVLSDYEGDAGRIWGDEPTARLLQERLVAFPGISQKKAAMAVEILERDLGVPVREMEGSDLAFDVHVRRVMLRTGLASRDDQTHMIERARQLNPERPGALDFPLWGIGRTWCHAGEPSCSDCVLVSACPKLIDAASDVKGM